MELSQGTNLQACSQWKSQTTYLNVGQAHRLALGTPTLDLCLEITISKKFVIQGFIWITQKSNLKFLLYCKPKWHNMIVGARKGFAYRSVKLVSLANGNRYEVDSKNVLCKWWSLLFYPINYEVLLCPNSDLFRNAFVSVVCGWGWVLKLSQELKM